MNFRKFFFGVFLLISVILAFKIGSILINDVDRLTNYGFGYLTGLIVVFVIALIISFIIGKKLFGKKINL